MGLARTDEQSNRRSGFTLVEIMITLAMIASVGGLIVVNLGSLTKNERLKSAARELSGLSAYARSHATGSRRTAYIDYDFVANRFRMRADPMQDELGRFIDPEDGHFLSEDELAEWEASFEWDDLPRDVYFRRLYLSHKSYYDAKNEIVTASYYADGSVQSYILWIQGSADEGKEGRYFSIVVNGLTGMAEVVEGAANYPEAVETDFSEVMGPDAPGGAEGGSSRGSNR